MKELSTSELEILARTRWTSNTITYSIDPNTASTWTLEQFQFYFGASQNFGHVQPISIPQWQAFQSAIALWQSVANISIDLALGGSTPDITIAVTDFSHTPVIRDPTSGKLKPRIGAETQAFVVPLNDFSSPIQGDIWLSHNRPSMGSAYMSKGGSGFSAILHELGHALGLRGDRSLGGYSWNSTRYTVMSYEDLQGDQIGHVTSGAAHAPMLLDIAAIQMLYGANANTNNGSNDVYEFKMEYGWPIQAIWDAGGSNDSISFGTEGNRRLRSDRWW